MPPAKADKYSNPDIQENYVFLDPKHQAFGYPVSDSIFLGIKIKT
jgi:hypothetical protein